jgi:hypothetical protein
MRLQAALAFAMLVVAVAVISAQVNQLFGTVRDRLGAVLPGVTVTINSPALDLPRTTTTDTHGEFTFKSLPPNDAYVVTFSLEGFRPVVQRKVAIVSDKAATADAVMSVGDIPKAPPSYQFPSNYGVVLISPQ